MKNILLALFFLVALVSCQNRQQIGKYYGWMVIQKPTQLHGDGGDVFYWMIIQKGERAKKVYTYEYYYRKYNIGDIIAN